MGRRRSRSTQAPAGRPKRMNGRNSTVPRRPTWKALALSRSTAISGSPSSVTWVPNWLMVSPVHSLRKSGCRHRLRSPGRRRRLRPESTAGPPSPLATMRAPSGLGPPSAPALRGPGDGHERDVDPLGSLGVLLALLVGGEQLLDLLPDADQLLGGDGRI